MRYYRRDGTPYPDGPEQTLAWARDFGDVDKRIVAQTRLWNGAFVSTVFLGLDHQYGDGPPLIFETMVFDIGPVEDTFGRWSTEDEAWYGHLCAMRRYRSDPRIAIYNLKMWLERIWKRLRGA